MSEPPSAVLYRPQRLKFADDLTKEYIDHFQLRRKQIGNKIVDTHDELQRLHADNPKKYWGVPALLFSLVVSPDGACEATGSPLCATSPALKYAINRFVQDVSAYQRTALNISAAAAEGETPQQLLQPPVGRARKKRAPSAHTRNQATLITFWKSQLLPRAQAAQDAELERRRQGDQSVSEREEGEKAAIKADGFMPHTTKGQCSDINAGCARCKKFRRAVDWPAGVELLRNISAHTQEVAARIGHAYGLQLEVVPKEREGNEGASPRDATTVNEEQTGPFSSVNAATGIAAAAARQPQPVQRLANDPAAGTALPGMPALPVAGRSLAAHVQAALPAAVGSQAPLRPASAATNARPPMAGWAPIIPGGGLASIMQQALAVPSSRPIANLPDHSGGTTAPAAAGASVTAAATSLRQGSPADLPAPGATWTGLAQLIPSGQDEQRNHPSGGNGGRSEAGLNIETAVGSSGAAAGRAVVAAGESRVVAGDGGETEAISNEPLPNARRRRPLRRAAQDDLDYSMLAGMREKRRK